MLSRLEGAITQHGAGDGLIVIIGERVGRNNTGEEGEEGHGSPLAIHVSGGRLVKEANAGAAAIRLGVAKGPVAGACDQ